MITTIICTVFYWIGLADFNQQADEFFKTYVEDGQVKYQELSANPQPIQDLYKQLSDISLEEISAAERKAFYINAYNLITIYQIVERFPVGSPMDILGFFDTIKHDVAGESLTLNELEKERLFARHFDARLHFVLVCAAKSCPSLANFAYRAENLDTQLEEKTKQALNDPNFIRVNSRKQQVAVSKIFEWYKEDFLKESSSLIAYINQYRDKPISTQFTVAFYEYNWQLNQL